MNIPRQPHEILDLAEFYAKRAGERVNLDNPDDCMKVAEALIALARERQEHPDAWQACSTMGTRGPEIDAPPLFHAAGPWKLLAVTQDAGGPMYHWQRPLLKAY